jgi:hypothetical protein
MTVPLTSWGMLWAALAAYYLTPHHAGHERCPRLWREQGRPVDVPIVLHPGTLRVDGNGRCTIDGWTFGTCMMRSDIRSVDPLQMWEHLSARYPLTYDLDR